MPLDMIVCDENELIEGFQRALDELLEGFPEAEFAEKRYRAGEPVHELVSEDQEQASHGAGHV